MVEKVYGEYVVQCDECGVTDPEEYEIKAYDSFQSCIDSMKKAGWKIQKIDDNWTHLCPQCKKKVGDNR